MVDYVVIIVRTTVTATAISIVGATRLLTYAKIKQSIVKVITICVHVITVIRETVQIVVLT